MAADHPLGKYIPHAAVPVILAWLRAAPIRLKVSRPRRSKLGDYSPATKDDPVHRITVNGDLNKFAFLITLVHEFAHFTTYQRAKWEIKPHGPEWQYEYKRLMTPFLESDVFPEDLRIALSIHLQDAPASSCCDHGLMRMLRKYDNGPSKTFVEEVPFNSLFMMDGRTFRKGRKLRKRYSCFCLDDRREYYVDALAEVIPCPPVNT